MNKMLPDFLLFLETGECYLKTHDISYEGLLIPIFLVKKY